MINWKDRFQLIFLGRNKIGCVLKTHPVQQLTSSQPIIASSHSSSITITAFQVIDAHSQILFSITIEVFFRHNVKAHAEKDGLGLLVICAVDARRARVNTQRGGIFEHTSPYLWTLDPKREVSSKDNTTVPYISDF